MGDRQLETLTFHNTYARLPEAFYAKLNPTPFSSPPYLVSFNAAAADLIDLDPREAKRPEFTALFGGSMLTPAMEPLAMLYSGHQFGVYVPQLGDGRAILLGEATNARGERWDLHLKGAGMTPFSRDGDGRAVLRSTIREYLCSEAMHALGIPTTRALSIIGSDEKVYREQVESGAMLLRMAPSHVRFGTFEIFYYRRQHEHLRVLADYVIDHHYPHLRETPDKYAALFAQVVDAGFICNHSDHNGRYAFNQQPFIGLWNLSCLAQALLPLAEKDALKEGLDGYMPLFEREYRSLMRAKLGLADARDQDEELIREFMGLLQGSHADYTIVWRELGGFLSGRGMVNDRLREHFLNRERFDAWAVQYAERLRAEGSRDDDRQQAMNRVNPKYVLRNYLAQAAIEKAQQKDFAEIDRLLALLQRPYTDQPGMEGYAVPPPNWGKHLSVSCSS
jgi:uncharacterized protein YdiU (UPF0061 family)